MHPAIAARRAFSLIELVIVVVIIGIIAAIAVPRMSRGAAGATDASLTGSLAVLRNAIDLYAQEHGGGFPPAATFEDHMLKYTNSSNSCTPVTSASGDFVYGPYLRALPALPVGAKKGKSGVAAADGASVGWIYNQTTGVITANTTTEADASGKLYSSY